MDTQSAISREVTVAAGAFAPGHLGELTRTIGFDMVDEALAQTRRTQQRVRDLPSRVVIYLLLAGALFPELGWRQVWQRLTAGLAGIPVATPTAGALAQARRRLGHAPLKWLFDLLRGPAPAIATPGVHWRGLLVCAIDGTTMSVADSPANLSAYAKHRCNNGGAGYPALRMLALLSCGTRTLIDAVYGPTAHGETTYAPGLLPSMGQGMLVLADRAFAARDLVGAIAATGAHILVRVKNDRRLPVLARLTDGSYLSRLGTAGVRVIDCEITVATAGGRRTRGYRLVTTLTDHRIHPAGGLVELYHQRWEIETAYLEIKSSLGGGRVLRARTPEGIDQEVYALLVTYQVLRLCMADATAARPGVDPDRAGFTVAVNAARDLVIQAAGVIAGAVIDLVGTIGRRVLDDLLPDRRVRSGPRVVKRAISKYNAKGAVDRTSYKATISINIMAVSSP
ncbi:IS4 family transposase [Streptomonospora wellingtoniae]|uniref:IS4 family transposase n=1 Tax=Streptomonospora wellingtoniae TaxID=3075544 RepID=A0ABU2L176_9ACTN|nr:IS4 family transposase [Streptomonospora sp. DSM 45055]MDT0305312.1 IS4 family transposase [Streptomonospora sp. DSM 45055]